GFAVSDVHTGYVYDPGRHQAPALGSGGVVDVSTPGLEGFSRRLNRVAGTPLLSSAGYATLFQVILDDIIARRFSLVETSKAVRDECARRDNPVGRNDVNYVLNGLRRGGCPLHDPVGISHAREVGENFLGSVLLRCEEVELQLTEEEKVLLREWILGKCAPV